MNQLHPSIQSDIQAIGSIDAVPSILEVVCCTTGMGFAAVARVTEDHWIACAVRDEIRFGLVPGGELKLETTICNEIRQHHQVVVIDHVSEDPEFACHHTPAMYGFQSYISVPIILKDGSFFGTLCAIDPKPAKLDNPQIRGMFRLFAEMIAMHLHNLEQVKLSASMLTEERKTAELREQFIAILGHDLRNPVGAVSNVAQLLLRMPLDERTTRLANILKDASFRMKDLIENILDFARGRLGEGIVLDRHENEPLQQVLEQVISELSVIWPKYLVETEFMLTVPVSCDGKRIAQLFSNLLSNAITHGNESALIKVRAFSDQSGWVLSVTNSGKKIPDSTLARLFQPFSRGNGGQGLGLGLYIASEIAKAHGGILSVISTHDETCFTLNVAQNGNGLTGIFTGS